MTILSMNKKELEKKVGKIDEAMEHAITNMGTPVEEVTDTDVAVEIFPNRPDLLSIENFAKALNEYRGKRKPGAIKVHAPEKNYEVIIDKSVKGIRNHTVCCIVKGLKLTEEKIMHIIDVQEKLHNSLGRKRKKGAIGIYPLEKIQLPITFTAKDPKEVTFKPLEFPKEITAKQVLTQHPTGKEYSHLLEGKEKFPFFMDAKGSVLSLPPIINSEETGRITESTKEVFIECSGDNLHYLKKILHILVLAFSEMGGKIYAMNIVDKKDKSFASPDMTPQEMPFNIDDINKTLGLELKESEIKKLLEKMGISYENKKGKGIAHVPAYRADILHWIDIAEEVAIAYGYDKFDPIIPDIATIGTEDTTSILKKTIGNILAGLGIQEISSYHLTTKKNIKKIYFDMPVEEYIEVEDSKTERDTLRKDLVTNIIHTLKDNSDAQYPQKIGEIGTVFAKDSACESGIKETQKVAVALIDEHISFTDIKQILEYVTKMLNKTYTLEAYDEHPAYIKGRAAKIRIDNKDVGYIGEISPRVLKNFKIKAPVVAFEMDMDALQ